MTADASTDRATQGQNLDALARKCGLRIRTAETRKQAHARGGSFAVFRGPFLEYASSDPMAIKAWLHTRA
ncbi:MAG: hypothetical protein QM599_01795 [Pseudoxanthomonas sp.]